MDERRAITLRKPSGTVAIFTSMDLSQRKTYDAFLYIAQQQLAADPQKTWFEVDLSVIKKLCGLENDKNNKHLKALLKEMATITIEYNLLHKDVSIEGITTALHDIEFHFEPGKSTKVRFALPIRVRNALVSHDAIYAVVDLIIKKELQSKYSVILYDLCKDYEKVQVPELSIEEFKKIFGLLDPDTGKTKYSRITDIKARVLDPACDELNNNPKVSFSVSYNLIKGSSGNEYKSIKFTARAKTETELASGTDGHVPIKPEPEDVALKVLIDAVPPAFRNNGMKDYLARASAQYGLDYVLKQIEYTNSQNPRNYLAFLKSSVLEDYAGAGSSEEVRAIEEAKNKLKPRSDRLVANESKYFIPIKLGDQVFYLSSIDWEGSKVSFYLENTAKRTMSIREYNLPDDQDKVEQLIKRIEDVYRVFEEQ